MRKTFIKKLCELAAKDQDIYLLAGDLGFSVVEPFKNAFPDRFFNVGIAEQNMIGVAAGLAMMGKKVFVYSITPFVTMRCFEQIRVDLCYQNLPVRLVGVGAGLMYGTSATTHHAIEDIAIMRSLPNMTIISPANDYEVENLLEQSNALPGPVYFRLSKNSSDFAYDEHTAVELGKTVEVIKNDEYVICTTGEMFGLGFDVCKRLKHVGIDVGLASVHTIKPFDYDFLLSKKKNLKAIFTIEEHSCIGGLGEIISSFICKSFERNIVFKSFALKDAYFHSVGSRDYLLAQSGLQADVIFNEIIKKLRFFSVMKKELHASI